MARFAEIIELLDYSIAAGMHVANDQPDAKAPWLCTGPYDVILNVADRKRRLRLRTAHCACGMAVDHVLYWRR